MKGSSRLISLLVVVAGLFGPAAPALHAQGVIVTMLPQPMGMSSDLFTILYPIDVNEDGLTDFTFGAEAGDLALRTERANQLIVRLSPPPNIGGPVARLLDGFEVGSSFDPEMAWLSSDPVGGYVDPGEIAFATIVQCLSSGCLSDWPGGPFSRAFIGFQFELEDGLHYGYFDVAVRGDIPGGQLFGWAYESSPDTPIVTALVPEPSTVALAGIGGLLLFWRWRRGQ